MVGEILGLQVSMLSALICIQGATTGVVTSPETSVPTSACTAPAAGVARTYNRILQKNSSRSIHCVAYYLLVKI